MSISIWSTTSTHPYYCEQDSKQTAAGNKEADLKALDMASFQIPEGQFPNKEAIEKFLNNHIKETLSKELKCKFGKNVTLQEISEKIDELAINVISHIASHFANKPLNAFEIGRMTSNIEDYFFGRMITVPGFTKQYFLEQNQFNRKCEISALTEEEFQKGKIKQDIVAINRFNEKQKPKLPTLTTEEETAFRKRAEEQNQLSHLPGISLSNFLPISKLFTRSLCTLAQGVLNVTIPFFHSFEELESACIKTTCDLQVCDDDTSATEEDGSKLLPDGHSHVKKVAIPKHTLEAQRAWLRFFADRPLMPQAVMNHYINQLTIAHAQNGRKENVFYMTMVPSHMAQQTLQDRDGEKKGSSILIKQEVYDAYKLAEKIPSKETSYLLSSWVKSTFSALSAKINTSPKLTSSPNTARATFKYLFKENTAIKEALQPLGQTLNVAQVEELANYFHMKLFREEAECMAIITQKVNSLELAPTVDRQPIIDLLITCFADTEFSQVQLPAGAKRKISISTSSNGSNSPGSGGSNSPGSVGSMSEIDTKHSASIGYFNMSSGSASPQLRPRASSSTIRGVTIHHTPPTPLSPVIVSKVGLVHALTTLRSANAVQTGHTSPKLSPSGSTGSAAAAAAASSETVVSSVATKSVLPPPRKAPQPTTLMTHMAPAQQYASPAQQPAQSQPPQGIVNTIVPVTGGATKHDIQKMRLSLRSTSSRTLPASGAMTPTSDGAVAKK